MPQVSLNVTDLQWLGATPEEVAADQCAHGRVELSIDGDVLVSPADGLLTVSAAGLYLLRTLDQDHRPDVGVALSSQLFPCCGFAVYRIPDPPGIICFGCATGVDLELVHAPDRLWITGKSNTRHDVDPVAWRGAVARFCGEVEAFYTASGPRRSPRALDEQAGWWVFWVEWRRRLAQARA